MAWACDGTREQTRDAVRARGGSVVTIGGFRRRRRRRRRYIKRKQ